MSVVKIACVSIMHAIHTFAFLLGYATMIWLFFGAIS